MAVQFTHYGEERELQATDGELAIFSALIDIIEAAGLKTDQICMTRKSDNYLTATLGPIDIARFKWTDRAKWIQLPYAVDGKTKHPLTGPSDLKQYERQLLGHYYMGLSNILLGYE